MELVDYRILDLTFRKLENYRKKIMVAERCIRKKI